MRATYRARYGFDDPLIVQYVRWLGMLLSGDLGWSTWQQRPVLTMFAEALPNTLLLVGVAMTLSVVCGVALGAWQGAHPGSLRDRVASTVSFVVYAVPEFGLALGLLLIFSEWLHWLPATGMTSELSMYQPVTARWLDRLRHLILPVLSLTAIASTIVARYQRLAMRDTLSLPFVQTARAYGLPESRVRRQAWRASLLPVITVVGLILPSLVTGTVFVERVFGWPGMGMLLLDAIFKRDYAVVTAGIVLGSAMTAFATALADLAREAADPRLRPA